MEITVECPYCGFKWTLIVPIGQIISENSLKYTCNECHKDYVIVIDLVPKTTMFIKAEDPVDKMFKDIDMIAAAPLGDGLPEIEDDPVEDYPMTYKGWQPFLRNGYIRMSKKIGTKTHELYIGKEWNATKASEKIDNFYEKLDIPGNLGEWKVSHDKKRGHFLYRKGAQDIIIGKKWDWEVVDEKLETPW
ncbi:MAG: hypothetical protein GY718_14435 [Lentisphaerae bacterium]|nr:hypothetical protein [Lentisphaerota bacterium]